jgi:hypothetical protein
MDQTFKLKLSKREVIGFIFLFFNYAKSMAFTLEFCLTLRTTNLIFPVNVSKRRSAVQIIYTIGQRETIS